MLTDPVVTESLYGFETRDVDQRKAPVGERKTYDIKKLWQHNHEIINLAAQGFKQLEIAEILGISPATVSNTLNSTLGQQKLSEIRFGRDIEAKKTNEKIRILTTKALQTYHEIFDDDSGNVSLKDKKQVADTVLLELSGLRAPTRVQSLSATLNLTPEELNEFKKRGIAAARESGMIVEAEYESKDPVEENQTSDQEAESQEEENL